jgi:hypothetical protein
VVVSEHDYARVEREIFLGNLLAPGVDTGHAVEAEFVGEAYKRK